MFTGIVEQAGTVCESRVVSGGRKLSVDARAMTGECKIGDSICVQGVCLTIAAVTDNILIFDVIAETLQKTTLGRLTPGDRVNLERSLRADGRFDGHFVQGHVEGMAEVTDVRRSSREYVIAFKPEERLIPYLIPKGSVAIDGVSLTIAEVGEEDFNVALIPTTLERTTLGSLSIGAFANVETDIISRTIVHQLSRMSDAFGMTSVAVQKAGLV